MLRKLQSQRVSAQLARSLSLLEQKLNLLRDLSQADDAVALGDRRSLSVERQPSQLSHSG